MLKVDYNKKMNDIISGLNFRPTLLLHSCCGPCSSWVIKRLKDYFDITVVYYNPNIYPIEEYIHRKSEQQRLLKELNIKFLDCEYNEDVFLNFTKGLEGEKEGGARCTKCFYLRLSKTAQIASENGFDFFATTLTVSPHKNAELINKLGDEIAKKYNISYLFSDFKKENGYLNSIKLSKEYNLYRQNYCGCRYSLNNQE